MEEEIKKIVVDLVQYIKEVGPEVWVILIRQQIAEGIISALAVVLSLCGVFWGLRVLKSEPEWACSNDVNIGGTLIAIIAGLFLLISLTVFGSEGLLKLLNPAYYALTDLKP